MMARSKFIYLSYVFIFVQTSRSQHHTHSALPLPPQEHALAPRHHKQLPWGFPPSDERWPMPPPPHHFPGGPQQHFPPVPPGPGGPLDPGLMQRDGIHRGVFGTSQANFKPLHIFQQQSRGFSSGGQGSSGGNWQGEQGSNNNHSVQNGRMGVSHHDPGALERHNEGKTYKKFKTHISPHR